MRSSLLRLAAVLPLAVALSGCFQMASLLTVRADGSATLVDTMRLSEQALGFLAGADSTRDGLADRAYLDARAASLGPGVRLLSVEEHADGYTATYGVDHVDRLRFSLPRPPTGEDALPDSADTDAPYTFALAEAGGGTHALAVTVPDNRTAPADSTAAPADPEQQRQGLQMARLLLGDARVTFRIAVDGDVVETDAPFADDGTLTLVDVQMGSLIDLLIAHPELAGATEPPLTEIARLAEGRDGLQVQPPGTVRIRFD